MNFESIQFGVPLPSPCYSEGGNCASYYRSLFELVLANDYLELTDPKLLGWFQCLTAEDKTLIQSRGIERIKLPLIIKNVWANLEMFGKLCFLIDRRGRVFAIFEETPCTWSNQKVCLCKTWVQWVKHYLHYIFLSEQAFCIVCKNIF